VTVCTTGYYKDDYTGLCVDPHNCERGTYADDGTDSCVPPLDCDIGTYANEDSDKCDTVCPDGQVGDPATGKCEIETCIYTEVDDSRDSSGVINSIQLSAPDQFFLSMW